MIKEFIVWLRAQVGSIYVWGAQGECVNADYIEEHETNNANVKRALALYYKRRDEGFTKIRAYDCSGLIVRFLLDNGLIEKDTNANGLWKKCVPTNKMHLLPGDFVFRYSSNSERMSHIGVYIGGNKVIHSKGRDVGVVCEDIEANGRSYWQFFGRYEKLNVFKEMCTVQISKLKRGMNGTEVVTLQIMLTAYNCPCGNIDGKFGQLTETAVKDYQASHNLAQDGIVGEKTWNMILRGSGTNKK